jgi:hypothetical protein
MDVQPVVDADLFGGDRMEDACVMAQDADQREKHRADACELRGLGNRRRGGPLPSVQQGFTLP